MTNPNAIGYCAVISPQIDFWQGYFIIDTPALAESAQQMQAISLLTAGKANPYGALQAALAEGAITNNDSVVGAAALALKGGAGSNFFYILANKEPAGTATSLHKLNARSIDEARAQIENLEPVLAIKSRLIEKLSARDGAGRRVGFH